MKLWMLLSVLGILLRPSRQDCKVLANCEKDDLRWKKLPTSTGSGRPGKRGAPGLRGERGLKGELGETTVIQPPEEDWGPTRQFLADTINWDSANTYCLGIGRRLCRGNEICIHENGGRRMIHEVLRGDHWTPILDAHNHWLQVGDSRRFTCHSLAETHNGATAINSIKVYPWKSYVYCCGKKYAGKRYRYIGQTATYNTSVAHCLSEGRRLCYASEICNRNTPVFGVIARNTWVPVNDRYNEWIQIGNKYPAYRMTQQALNNKQHMSDRNESRC